MPRVAATRQQLHGWLAEPEDDLSCRSFSVHLEIIHKLRDSKLWTPVMVVM